MHISLPNNLELVKRLQIVHDKQCIAWPEGKKIAYSARLKLKFILPINVKMPGNNGWHFNIYKQDKLQALKILT